MLIWVTKFVVELALEVTIWAVRSTGAAVGSVVYRTAFGAPRAREQLALPAPEEFEALEQQLAETRTAVRELSKQLVERDQPHAPVTNRTAVTTTTTTTPPPPPPTTTTTPVQDPVPGETTGQEQKSGGDDGVTME